MPPEQESMLSAEDAAHLIEQSIINAMLNDDISMHEAFDGIRAGYDGRVVGVSVDDVWTRYILPKAAVIANDVNEKKKRVS